MKKLNMDLVISGKQPSFMTTNQTKKIIRQTLAALGRDSAVLGVAFLTEKQMAEKNRIYHHKTGPTDVLSFNHLSDEPKVLAGDVLICPAFAIRQAKEAQEKPERELSRLLIHGLLHIAGHDHAEPAEEKRMFRLQERILQEV